MLCSIVDFSCSGGRGDDIGDNGEGGLGSASVTEKSQYCKDLQTVLFVLLDRKV